MLVAAQRQAEIAAQRQQILEQILAEIAARWQQQAEITAPMFAEIAAPQQIAAAVAAQQAAVEAQWQQILAAAVEAQQQMQMVYADAAFAAQADAFAERQKAFETQQLVIRVAAQWPAEIAAPMLAEITAAPQQLLYKQERDRIAAAAARVLLYHGRENKRPRGILVAQAAGGCR